MPLFSGDAISGWVGAECECGWCRQDTQAEGEGEESRGGGAVSMWLARRVRVSGRQCHNDESYTAWLSSPARRPALGSECICEALNANVFSACAASCSALVSAPM